jgi:EAL domain-containing protein (putative c-di-GMP-specific phosphodiesterase class I)
MFQHDRATFETAVAEAPAPADAGAGGAIDRFLRAARAHLHLEVAYVSEIVGNESVFRHVDAPGLEHLVKPGDRKSLDDVYCRHILEGRLPELIPDTAAEPLALSMPITAAVPIGAHVSVPVRLPDGSLYGMFCCLGPMADPSLNPRDLGMMRTLADLAAAEIAREQQDAISLAARRAPIEAMLASGAFETVLQPIWRLGRDRPIGFESLTRFHAEPRRGPDIWFEDAAAVGFGTELELAAIAQALAVLGQLPDDIYLTVNASPSTACDPRLLALLATTDLSRLVLEITEQQRFEDMALLEAALSPFRASGMRLAVDDAGSGYAGLQQILGLRPDIIKLDRFFVREIDRDPVRRALAAALAEFSAQVGCQIVAEGVEEDAELQVLRTLGFQTIQGYLLGRPGTLAAAQALASGAAVAA